LNQHSREEVWTDLMRAALTGDAIAYRQFLLSVTPYLRALARRRCQRVGAPVSDAEDVVQEVLLAVHLKRGTWDQTRPIGPWISTIVRHKMIDALRRRGRHTMVPIDDVVDMIESVEQEDFVERRDVERLMTQLNNLQRDIVQSISLNGASIQETAARLRMKDGTVRVALHRALKALAALYRSDCS
jgi:RNA polymerase sigma factor (sigma-70 family)